MSKTHDRVNARFDALERQADSFLREADPKGADHGLALLRALRKALRQNRKSIDAIRAEVLAEVRAEMVEAALRRLGVPAAARAAFDGIDPTDQQAMAARARELREAGVTWPAGQPSKAEVMQA